VTLCSLHALYADLQTLSDCESLRCVKFSLPAYSVTAVCSVNFWHYAEITKLFRPITKLAETVQIVVFGAETETETEFRSVFKLFLTFVVLEVAACCLGHVKNKID